MEKESTYNDDTLKDNHENNNDDGMLEEQEKETEKIKRENEDEVTTRENEYEVITVSKKEWDKLNTEREEHKKEFRKRQSEHDKLQAEEEANIKEENRVRFRKRREELLEQFPDFDEVAFSDKAEEIYIKTPHLANIVSSMPKNSDLAYYLGKNIDKLKKISKIKPIYMAAEIAKLNYTISSSPRNKITSAPEPIVPLKTVVTSTQTFDPDKVSMKEWKKWREKTKRK